MNHEKAQAVRDRAPKDEPVFVLRAQDALAVGPVAQPAQASPSASRPCAWMSYRRTATTAAKSGLCFFLLHSQSKKHLWRKSDA